MEKLKNFWLNVKKLLKADNEHDYDKDIINAVKRAVKPTELTASNFDSLSRWFYVELYIILLGAIICLPKPDAMSIAAWIAFVLYFVWSATPFIKVRKAPSFKSFFQGKPFIVKLLAIHLISIAITFLVMAIHFGLLPKELPGIVNSIFIALYFIVYFVMSFVILIITTSFAGRRLINRFTNKK